MSARIHDNPFRWLISSKSRPGEHHLVDIQAHRGHGECSCEDFTMNKIKRIRLMEARSMRTRCKHIVEAREAFSVWLIDRIQDGSIPEEVRNGVTHLLNFCHLSHLEKVNAHKGQSVPLDS